MQNALWVISSEAKASLWQHLRSPALWFIALAAPIAANYMVPAAGANYAVLTVNGAYPTLTPAVLGLELGVITATLLTPIAYIFLRAGPTRKRPCQITDVAPQSRIAVAIGRWMADVGILWLLLAGLTVAGWMLGLFRLPPGEWNILHTTIALWAPAAPALALIAAIRTFLDARPVLSRWPGDVLFVVLWMGMTLVGLIASVQEDEGPVIAAPMSDPFGFITPIVEGSAQPVQSLSIGSSPGITEAVSIDALAGVMNDAFLSTRVLWILIALGIALFAGMMYYPHSRKSRKSKMFSHRGKSAKSSVATGLDLAQSYRGQRTEAAHLPLVNLLICQIKLILRNRNWLIAILIAAAIGLVAPYREVAAPAIWLVLLFPLTHEGGQWQSASLRALLNTGPMTQWSRFWVSVAAGIAILVGAHIPSIIQALWHGETSQFVLMAKIILGIPFVAVALGTLTRNAIAGWLILLIAWYAFFSSASG